MLPYIVTILGAYLIGCSNMALYLSRWKGVNLRAGGSKNLGASNAFALMGWKAGLLVAVHDIGKAVLAVELSKWIFPAVPLLGFIAGVACVLGHMFPFYLKFKGGQGLCLVSRHDPCHQLEGCAVHSRGGRYPHCADGLHRRRHRDRALSRSQSIPPSAAAGFRSSFSVWRRLPYSSSTAKTLSASGTARRWAFPARDAGNIR